MTTETTAKRPIEEARERLRLLSLEVADLVKEGMFFTVNDAIMETLYKDKANLTFKTYRQWKKDGKQVRKGEKAFLLWGKPKEIKKKGEAEEKAPAPEQKEKEDVEKVMQFFPIAYLFSNAQVDDIEEPIQEPEQVEEREVLEPLPYD